ncbi:MAG: 2Fe-2S iron-sulfur cluster-binding protein [Porticoccaceae bacterium]
MTFRISMRNSKNEEVHFSCAADQVLSDAADLAGYRVTSCSYGFCGACTARIVSGSASLPFASDGKHHAVSGDEVLLCRCLPESDLSLEPRFSWLEIRPAQSTGTV